MTDITEHPTRVVIVLTYQLAQGQAARCQAAFALITWDQLPQAGRRGRRGRRR